MPTFTAIALDSLLEQGSRRSVPKPPPPVKVERPASSSTSNKKGPPRLFLNISPALYATPEATSVPTSPSSFPPSSPYIVNHKRRGPRLLKSFSQNDVGGADQLPVIGASQKADVVNNDGAEAAASGLHGSASFGEQKAVDTLAVEGATDAAVEIGDKSDVAGGGLDDGIDGELLSSERSFYVEPDRDAGAEDFFDPQDSLSVGNNSDYGDVHPHSWGKLSTPMSEYYDAFEEISSNYSARSSRRNVEDELHELRLNLLTEIDKRKQTEETLENLQTRWQMLSHRLSLLGLSLPAPPSMIDEINEHTQTNIDPAEDLFQQIVVTRFVADAIVRACSRAEVEMEMQPQIELKNFEISRLWDRLQYYEAANKEMSQRNQQAVEVARQKRYKRKKRQRWLWGSIGLAITIGAASIAWSYIPGSGPLSSESHGTELEGVNNESTN